MKVEEQLIKRGWRFRTQHIFKRDQLSRIKVLEVIGEIDGTEQKLQSVYWLRLFEGMSKGAVAVEEARHREEAFGQLLPIANMIESSIPVRATAQNILLI